jgi:hypothetical protein
MKEKILFVFLNTLIWSCSSEKERLVYMDALDKYYLRIEKAGEGVGDAIYVLYDFAEPSKMKETGIISNGFRNDLWTYNINAEAKTIKWGHYKDKYLGFETNVFSYIDSVKYGDSFTKFLFKTNNDRLILNVAINSFLKDSLPQTNYKRITEDEFTRIGMEVIYFNSRKILNHQNEIYLNEIKVRIIETNEIRIIKNAFSFLDKDHFIDFSVSSSENNIDAHILFNAVFTNFFIDGKRFYDPLVPSRISYPNWVKKDSTLNN